MDFSCFYADRYIFGRIFYSCNVKSATIVEPNGEINVIPLNERKNISRVQAIRFIQSTIYYVPRGFSRGFLNLSIVEINKCGLKTISLEDLDGLEKIKELWVENNDLVSLPSNLFNNMEQLELVSFAKNRLEFITSELLEPIKQSLKRVDLTKNRRIDAIFGSNRHNDNPSKNQVSLTQLMEMIDARCKKPAEDGPFLNDETFPEQFRKGLAEMWISGRLSDFVINANDSKSFGVHKNVLAISSPVFAAMLELDVEETRSGKMSISDFSSNAVEHFLGFLYTGRIPDVANAMELYSLATKYDVENLKVISEKIIMNSITEENAFEVFTLGHLHSAANIKQESFALIKKVLPGHLKSDDMMDDPEHLQKVIEAKRNYDHKLFKANAQFQAATRLRNFQIEQAQKEFDALCSKLED